MNSEITQIGLKWIICELYQAIMEDFALDAGDLSLEVFEVQYYNKYDGDEAKIWNAVEFDYL